FGIFMFFNHGTVAMGRKDYQQMGFYQGNIYFFLILIFVFFLPWHVYNLKKILVFIKNNPWKVLLLLIIFLPFFSFRLNHPWNKMDHNYFLRNPLFHLMLSNVQNKIITYVVLIWSALSIIATKLRKKKFYVV